MSFSGVRKDNLIVWHGDWKYLTKTIMVTYSFVSHLEDAPCIEAALGSFITTPVSPLPL